MRELFKPRNLQYNLRIKDSLDISKVRSTSYGIETVQFIGQKLWLMPGLIKSICACECRSEKNVPVGEIECNR